MCPVQSSAQRVAELMYASEATVFYHLSVEEMTVEAISEWIEGTIIMINDGECDEFTIADMREARLVIPEIVAVVQSWG